MKQTFLVLLLLVASFTQLLAQRELANPLIDSKEVIAKGVALHEEGKYKAAIETFITVPFSDTAYSSVLHELILSYYSDSNFVAAEKYAGLALKLYPDNNTQWYSLLADIYDDTKRSDLALRAYDTILMQDPYNYLAFFNKGITLYRLSRLEEAGDNFKRCLVLNPYYTSAHYFLGQLELQKGNLVPAMMSFTTNLLITPGNRYQKNAVGYLADIAAVNDDINGYLKKYQPGKEDKFEEIQEIIVSKIAIDKRYKLKANLEDAIVRQLQVLCEKLEYNANDKGFWMQFYVPFFRKIWDEQHFEPLVFHMFSGLDLPPVKEYNKKNKKKIEVFTDQAAVYLSAIRESQELVFNKRATATTRYYIKNYLVNGKGAYGRNAKNEEEVIGPWEFYYTNGRLKSKGDFDSEGRLNSTWKYYYENGILKEETIYKAGKAAGSSKEWNDNGLLYTTTTYLDDNIEGVKTTYFYSGPIMSVILYKAGKKEGLAQYYNINGYLRTVTNYANDLQEGIETVYYANGKKESALNYTKDLADGEYKEYYDDGKLKMSGSYIEGKKSGPWKSVYPNGTPELVEIYAKGKLDGEYLSYYANGKMESKRVYKNGEVDGKKEDFADDGKVFSESIFETGRLRDMKYFDKQGANISNTTSRKGNGDIPMYNADGTKVSQGYYSKDGLAEGKFIYYYRNGQVSAETFYKNGLEEGKKTRYYANGKIRQEGAYKADKPNGYFVDYYGNGQVSEEGWYVDGDRQGTFYNYDLLGKPTNTVYYLNDKIHGIADYFTPEGKLDYRQYYDHAWFNSIEQFDITGKTILVASALKQGVGKVRFDHFNGTPYFESNYRFYKLNGAYKVTNGDGSKRTVCYYKNGSFDSLYTSFHPNGQLQVEGAYKDGNRTGTWKYYYYNGKLLETEQYVDGSLHGADTQYDEQGNIDTEHFYKEGELHGDIKYYGDNQQIMVVYHYKDGDMLGYSYQDKNGQLLPMIKLVNGSGVVESYYKNGTRSVHLVFNEGNVDGKRTLYYSNGKPQVTGTRINGLENGLTTSYYPGGGIKQEDNYYYGERHGSNKNYNETGVLLSALNYYLGSLHGECKYYTAGKLTATYLYHYGLLESKK